MRTGVSGGLPQGELVPPPHKHASYFSVLSSISIVPLEQTGEVGVIIMSMLQMSKLRVREAKWVAGPK